MEHFDISLGDSLSSLSFQILSFLLFFLLSFIKLLSSPFTCHTSSKLQFQKLSFSLARIVWLSYTHTLVTHLVIKWSTFSSTTFWNSFFQLVMGLFFPRLICYFTSFLLKISSFSSFDSEPYSFLF